MTSMVIPQKISNKLQLRHRFTRLDKYFFNHKKRRNTELSPEDEVVAPAVQEGEGDKKDN